MKTKIAIVVGHSKKKTGAYNKSLNINEFFLNEELGKEIHERCNKLGIANILIYRENGYNQLPHDINKFNPTHTICIHHNASSNKKINGTETLHWIGTKTSDNFARLVNNKMAAIQGYNNRGLKPVATGENGGHVLRYTNSPCILLEVYFMSNDAAVLNRNYKNVASAVIDGFLEYVDSE